MSLHWTDHLVVVVAFVLFPIVDTYRLRRKGALIRAGQTEQRSTMYASITWETWATCLVVVALWFGLGRDAKTLGLVLRIEGWAWAGLALALVLCGLVVAQTRMVAASAEQQARLREQGELLSWFGPHTPAELRRFDLLSVTAGICEEVLFRGFLIAYLTTALGSPFWAGALLSSLAFGLAHSYQGPAGVVRTGSDRPDPSPSSTDMTGSLWASIVTHTVLDMSGGRVSMALASPPEPSATEPSSQPVD